MYIFISHTMSRTYCFKKEMNYFFLCTLIYITSVCRCLHIQRLKSVGFPSVNNVKQTSPSVALAIEDIQLQKYRKLGRDINRNVEKLQKLGYPIKKKYIFSPATADSKLQEIEKYLKILPEFRQKAMEMNRRNTHRESNKKESDDDDMDIQADDNPDPHNTDDVSEKINELSSDREDNFEKDGEKAAKEFIGNSGYGETSGNGDIMSLVNQEVGRLEEMIDNAVSKSTGIEDYTGFKAQKEKKWAKAQADLALSLGLNSQTATYLSGIPESRVSDSSPSIAPNN